MLQLVMNRHALECSQETSEDFEDSRPSIGVTMRSTVVAVGFDIRLDGARQFTALPDLGDHLSHRQKKPLGHFSARRNDLFTKATAHCNEIHIHANDILLTRKPEHIRQI